MAHKTGVNIACWRWYRKAKKQLEKSTGERLSVIWARRAFYAGYRFGKRLQLGKSEVQK